MSREEAEAAVFSTPWLAAAVMELDGDLNPKRFRRLALRHYINQAQLPNSSDGQPPEPQEGSQPTAPAPKTIEAEVVALESRRPQTREPQPARAASGPRYVPDGL